MKFLFKIENLKDSYEVKVFRHGNEVIAELKSDMFPLCKKTYKCVARNSEPEFDLSKGVRLAVARAKKEYFLDRMAEEKSLIKAELENLNRYLKTVEFLDKKYGLNRESRSNPDYTKGEYVLAITGDRH